VHIIAVSGYNLTIILRASKGLLSRYSRRLSLVFAFALIGLFLLFAGASASIVRAAMISVLSLLAAY
jgi:predicted membrane metal-binding protein